MLFRRLAIALPICGLSLVASAANDGAHIGTGEASYYGREFLGSRTANGEKFDPNALTAAHRTVAFGTRIRVTNLSNGKDVIVRVNDRGPWKKSRIIDISYAAARQIGMHKSGTAKVRLNRVPN
jgi:rare lipoprotein A